MSCSEILAVYFENREKNFNKGYGKMRKFYTLWQMFILGFEGQV